MIVTKIESVTKTRFKVYVDEQFAFVLYKGELSRYRIVAEKEIEEEIFQKLKKEVVLKRAKLRALHLLNDMDRTEAQLRTKLKQGLYTEDIEEIFQKLKKEVVLKRAKLRALHLLNDMDRTEAQLRTKLKQGLYTEDIIEQTIEYVKSFGYIGDASYARRYIESRRQMKSKKEIYAELCKKGVARDEIDSAMEECYEDLDETMAIQELLRKKRFEPKNATDTEKQKMYGYLARKGFSYDKIRQVIQVSDWNA